MTPEEKAKAIIDILTDHPGVRWEITPGFNKGEFRLWLSGSDGVWDVWMVGREICRRLKKKSYSPYARLFFFRDPKLEKILKHYKQLLEPS